MRKGSVIVHIDLAAEMHHFYLLSNRLVFCGKSLICKTLFPIVGQRQNFKQVIRHVFLRFNGPSFNDSLRQYSSFPRDFSSRTYPWKEHFRVVLLQVINEISILRSVFWEDYKATEECCSMEGLFLRCRSVGDMVAAEDRRMRICLGSFSSYLSTMHMYLFCSLTFFWFTTFPFEPTSYCCWLFNLSLDTQHVFLTKYYLETKGRFALHLKSTPIAILCTEWIAFTLAQSRDAAFSVSAPIKNLWISKLQMQIARYQYLEISNNYVVASPLTCFTTASLSIIGSLNAESRCQKAQQALWHYTLRQKRKTDRQYKRGTIPNLWKSDTRCHYFTTSQTSKLGLALQLCGLVG